MVIQCPACHARYRVRDIAADKAQARATCKKCGEKFIALAHVVVESEPADVAQILVVDDAKFFRELITEVLASQKVAVIEADSGERALQILAERNINLLIIDINLPDISGLELIRQIRRNERLADLAILCISGVHRKEEDLHRAIMAGADDFINKSFNPEEFNERIDRLLKQKTAR